MFFAPLGRGLSTEIQARTIRKHRVADACRHYWVAALRSQGHLAESLSATAWLRILRWTGEAQAGLAYQQTRIPKLGCRANSEERPSGS